MVSSRTNLPESSPPSPADRRIVFLINTMWGGGAERIVANLANHFHRTRGWRITILTLHGGPVGYPLDPTIQVRPLRMSRLNTGFLRLLAMPLFAAELAQELRRCAPDAVMSFLVRSNLTLVLSRWFGNRRRILISERCATDAVYRGETIESRTMLRLIAAFYPYADRIVAISRGVKDSLVRLGVPGDKIRVIYNPQNLDSIASSIDRASSRRASGGRPFTIVTAGRLTEQKDYPTLLQAFSHVCHEGLDARLIVLGDGPDAPTLKKLARRLTVDDRIDWKGWLDDPHPLMAECDAFVMTSRWEGFGNVLVEAMACGLPIISTDCESGPREILADGEYGILVPVGDSRATADAIRRLADDPAARAALRVRGRTRALDFDVLQVANEYADVLGADASETSR
jgi:glycosyltransferase involved in cell wall biosynthesis